MSTKKLGKVNLYGKTLPTEKAAPKEVGGVDEREDKGRAKKGNEEADKLLAYQSYSHVFTRPGCSHVFSVNFYLKDSL